MAVFVSRAADFKQYFAHDGRHRGVECGRQRDVQQPALVQNKLRPVLLHPRHGQQRSGGAAHHVDAGRLRRRGGVQQDSVRTLLVLRHGDAVLQEADQSPHAAFLQGHGPRRRGVALHQVGQDGHRHLPAHLALPLAHQPHQRGEELLLAAERRRGEQQVHVAVLDAQLAQTLQDQPLRRERGEAAGRGERVLGLGGRTHHPVQQPVQDGEADGLRVKRQVQLARDVGEGHQRVLPERRQAVPPPLVPAAGQTKLLLPLVGGRSPFPSGVVVVQQDQAAQDQDQARVLRQHGVVAGDEGEAAHDVGDADAAFGQRVLPGLGRGQRSLVPAARLVLQLADGTWRRALTSDLRQEAWRQSRGRRKLTTNS